MEVINLAKFNIVLTTYEVVLSEWKSSKKFCARATLFSVMWRRVVLDEGLFDAQRRLIAAKLIPAHYIRNRNALRSHAVYSLEAISRWAVTGTPIQNRLTDLASLIQFLRISPFDEPATFDTHILRPWMKKSDPKALLKLRELVRIIAIRRSKEILNLPLRKNLTRHIEFSSMEKLRYESLRNQIRSAVDNNVKLRNSNPHFNVLRWINDLRAACSRGFWDISDAMAAEKAVKHSSDLGSQVCDNITDHAEEDLAIDQARSFFEDDLQDLRGSAGEGDSAFDICSPKTLANGSSMSTPIQDSEILMSCLSPPQDCDSSVSVVIDSPLPAQSEDQVNEPSLHTVSSKIEAMLEDLNKESDNEKTYVG